MLNWKGLESYPALLGHSLERVEQFQVIGEREGYLMRAELVKIATKILAPESSILASVTG